MRKDEIKVGKTYRAYDRGVYIITVEALERIRRGQHYVRGQGYVERYEWVAKGTAFGGWSLESREMSFPTRCLQHEVDLEAALRDNEEMAERQGTEDVVIPRNGKGQPLIIPVGARVRDRSRRVGTVLAASCEWVGCRFEDCTTVQFDDGKIGPEYREATQLEILDS